MSDVVSYEVRDGVAVASIDNGKANALSHAVLEGLADALDRTEQAGAEHAGALVVAGKPGFLSGGFDLEVMRSGPEQAGALVTDGGALFTRFFESPVPVIVACTGHAVAAGALMLLGADERIGARGAFRIGLIETQIGMVLPQWAVELAEERLSRRHFQVATVGARMYDPDGARDAGYLDEVVEPDAVVDRAIDVAKEWAKLPRQAYEGQIAMNRGARLARLHDAVDADRGRLFTISSP
jgi:enoyl-CoA hydratase